MQRRFTIDNHVIKQFLMGKIMETRRKKSKFVVDILEELPFNKVVNFNKLSIFFFTNRPSLAK